MEFFIGVLVGWVGCIIWLVAIGARAYRKEYRRLLDGQGPVWHPPQNDCKDGHKWCEEHARQRQFHCVACGYEMNPGE